MKPNQAAALWNYLVGSDFGKAFECVIGLNNIPRIQTRISNDAETLDAISSILEEWTYAMKEFVEIEKQKPCEPDELKPKKKKKEEKQANEQSRI